MSSLRISHHSRAVGAPTSGADNSRSEAAHEGGSFAVALDAASATLKQAATWLGDQTGDTSDGTPPSHKRGAGSVKSDGAAGALAVAGALATAMGQVTTSTTAPATPAISDGNTAAAVPGSMSKSSVAAALAGRWQTSAGNAVVPQSTTVASPSTTTTGTTAVTSGGGVLSGAIPMSLTNRVGQGGGQAVVAPPIGNAAPVVNQTAGNTAAPVPIDPEATETHTHAAGMAATTNAPGMTLPASAGTPSDASVPGAADAIAVVATSPAAAPSATSSSDITSTMAAPTVLSPVAAAVTSPGQPNSGGAFGDGSFGASERGRYISVAATSASGDATTVAALGANSSAPVTTNAGLDAAPTPGGNETNAGTITDQITDHLLRLVSNGSREMTMRLHPPELGDLTVHVAVSGRDVSAWFASQQPQVQNAINDALGQLQTNLGNAGYNLTGAWVGADGSGAQRQGTGQPAPPIPASLALPSSALPAAVAAVSRPATSGLNIYV